MYVQSNAENSVRFAERMCSEGAAVILRGTTRPPIQMSKDQLVLLEQLPKLPKLTAGAILQKRISSELG